MSKMRILRAEWVETDKAMYIECAGNSDQDKPTEKVCSGSLCHEVDTKTIYAYDEIQADWIPQIVLSEE